MSFSDCSGTSTESLSSVSNKLAKNFKTQNHSPARKINETKDKLLNAAMTGAAFETVQKYGSAVKEHIVSFTGVDNETGMALKRGLDALSKSKINPNNEYANLNQQAGFAAELKYSARENARHIIENDKTRVINTDTKGAGKYNELFDHIVTKDGRIISQEQMKFVGRDVKECVNALTSQKYQKYRDNNAIFTLPSDYFEKDTNGIPKIQNELDRRIESLNKQVEKGNMSGEALRKKQQEIQNIKKLKESVKDSGITKSDAIEARLHPRWSTVKDMAKLAHASGVQQAKIGAGIGGTVSLVSNIVSVYKGDKDLGEATLCVAKDTAKSAAFSYATAFAGSLVKASMQNSGSVILRGASKSNLPAAIVSLSIDSAKSIKGFITGELSGVECMEQLGETGSCAISSAMFAVAGQVLIPIPVIGGMAGSMIGYALTSSCYGLLLGALKDAKLARERRIEIEKECEEHIKQLKQYRKEIEEYFNNYLSFYKQSFRDAFKQMKLAANIGDCDGYLDGCNKIIKALGKDPQFNTFDEFDALMNSDEPLRL